MGHVLVFGGVGSSFSTTPSLSHYPRFLRVALFIIDDSFSLVISPRLNQKMISSRQDELAPLSTTPSLSRSPRCMCVSLSILDDSVSLVLLDGISRRLSRRLLVSLALLDASASRSDTLSFVKYEDYTMDQAT
ncbi:hypothetical protein DY000_02061603 [Brassica cretica]|uniref:Uncharacterized protein n=1 Tax=Brassica cretica TaxID=69181 RepID=A0ABQ7AN88_BRACR|nr:hypothetical protein DY000_02061603 [Brassica cretica]